MLSVRGVTKRYGDLVALDGVDLDVETGEIVALLGPNGAGKTTLISIVAGLRHADQGTVSIDGREVTDDPDEIHRHVGIAPQETGAYETLSVAENLAFFADLYGTGDGAVERAVAALALTGLTDRIVRELSGGEKRRLHTAIAVISEAPILLLDEPTVGADVQTRAALLAAVRDLAANGTAVIYSTHYFPEVHELDARVSILDNGRTIAAGAPDELITAHAAAAVELDFRGPAPETLVGEPGAVVDGTVVRLPAARPAATLAAVLGRLGGDVDRIEAIELIRPDLDQVFVALTGRRYDPTGQQPDQQQDQQQEPHAERPPDAEPAS